VVVVRATHFRAGSLSWVRDESDPLTVILRWESAWLYNSGWITGGNTVQHSDLQINWGDATALSSDIADLVLTTGTTATDVLVVYAEFTHTYEVDGVYTIGIASCCRQSELQDSNGEAAYKVSVQFDTTSGVASTPFPHSTYTIGWDYGDSTSHQYILPVQSDVQVNYLFSSGAASGMNTVFPSGITQGSGGTTLVWTPPTEGLYSVQMKYRNTGTITAYSVSDFTIQTVHYTRKTQVPLLISHNATARVSSTNYTVTKGHTHAFRIRSWSLNTTEHTQIVYPYLPTGAFMSRTCEEGAHATRPPLSVGSNCTRTLYWKVPDDADTRSFLVSLIGRNADQRPSMALQFWLTILPNTDVVHPVDPVAPSIVYDFNTRFKDLFVTAGTLDVHVTIETAPHWDSTDPWGIMLRLGEGGYPGLDVPLDATTISTREDPPSAFPSYASWQVYFATQINAEHDFSALNSSQDAYQPLNPDGICTSVSYVYDSTTQRNVIQWNVAFNLEEVTTLYADDLLCVCEDKPLLDRMDCTVPISAVYRNSDGLSTYTPATLSVIIYNAGEVSGIIVGSLIYPFNALLSSVVGDTQGCDIEEGDVRLNVTYRVSYEDVEEGALVGPLSIDDISFYDNCYSLRAIDIRGPTCISGTCVTYIVIQTECRTPTNDGSTFLTCVNATMGRMDIDIYGKHCYDTVCIPLTAAGVSNTLYSTVLVGVTTTDTIELHYDVLLLLLDSPNTTSAIDLLDEPDASSADTEVPLIRSTSEWFTPAVFLDSSQSREVFDLQIDITNITIWGVNGALAITSGPYHWSFIQSSITHHPKAEGGVPLVCEGIPGCDSFSLPYSALSDLVSGTDATGGYRMKLYARFTPVSVTPVSGQRRLLSSSSSGIVIIGGGIKEIDIIIQRPIRASSSFEPTVMILLYTLIPLGIFMTILTFYCTYTASNSVSYTYTRVKQVP
jgi:hypothetical protein